jgi:hypothetical protein
MFVVSESDAAAIRTAFEQGGEFSAAIELRRRFPGIADNAQARLYARTIAGWQPPPPRPAASSPAASIPAGQTVTRLHPGRGR